MSALLRRIVASLATLAVFGVVFVALGPSEEEQAAQKKKKKDKAQPKPIAMSANLVGLEVKFGLKDEKVMKWDGEVKISEGKVLDLAITRGDKDAKVDGATFAVTSLSRMQDEKLIIDGPMLHVGLDAPLTATVTINTEQGKFQFPLSDLTEGSPKTFLDGQASVERADGAVRLTGRETEDDYPAMARAPDGTIWMAYVEYTPGRPVLMERLKAGNFDELIPKENGDQVRLMRFDGKTWHPPLDVTDDELDVHRPTIAVDPKGVVTIAWAQQVENDWEIFYRRYTPGKDGAEGTWADIVRLTKSPGSDFNVVSTVDSTGTVWLAWQAWRKDNFEIMLCALADNHPWKEPKVISNSRANDWDPAITADRFGNVYVAWDTYDKGNYDVRLAVVGKETKPNEAKIIEVANSAKFEARPSLACDGKGQLWIAYEEGDEQWGKDYANTADYKKIGLTKNPGYALYINRQVRVKCLVDGKLMQPVGDVQTAFANFAKRHRSCPRIAVDANEGIWLMVRQHPLPAGTGEVWNSYATRYDGTKWTPARRLPASANLMDSRPAMVPLAKGLLTVYSGDNRTRTQTRGQADLFATYLAGAEARAPALVAADAAGEAKMSPVHPDEAKDIARMREYRIDTGDKKLQLWRGEFHRHTEYGSHRDGDGSLEDAWRYGLDAGGLDWIGVGDHDNGFGHEFPWWQFQKMTTLYHNPPRFTGVFTYERSVVYPNGHRNVILPKAGIRPLPRGVLKGTPEKGSPDTKMLYACLKHFNGMCASHTSATKMGTDWRDNDPVYEPVVEIYQGHRHNYEHLGAPRSPTKETQIGGYEPAGFVWNAFEKGYRFGFEASSDHISTHISYAVVLTDDISRQGLIDAFKKRHSYGATDNIILDVRSGSQIMGDAFETAKRPTLDIIVQGTGPIAKLSIIKDNKYVYSTEPKQRDVKLNWTDMDAKAGATSYYYIRIEQADGNLAWASPMWITYKP